ncbi:hypothetical protein Rs2_13700 [Raphanus sativus]|nr:hypothetical protein Rs2_13700 [Raphanus sativus]
MVSDQDLAKGVETLLRQSDLSSLTSLTSVVQQLEAKLGLDLTEKTSFIRDQIKSPPPSSPINLLCFRFRINRTTSSAAVAAAAFRRQCSGERSFRTSTSVSILCFAFSTIPSSFRSPASSSSLPLL